MSKREQKIYGMICENIHLSVEQVMAELDISRAIVFRDYAKLKKSQVQHMIKTPQHGLYKISVSFFYKILRLT